MATPGRLLDLINRKAVVLKKVERIVLDEADEMLNMGFKEDIDAILEQATGQRRVWLFSATMPKAVRRIASNYMDDPAEIVVTTGSVTKMASVEVLSILPGVADSSEAISTFLRSRS